ncbi:MAG: hypothetical protein PHD67_03750 [Oscillospiraceae bacterium]|nr:hypothetical protein [Oscillospiraceae bacterium]
MKKKIAALLLGAVLCFSCGITALAETQPDPFDDQDLCFFTPGEQGVIGWLTLGEYAAEDLEIQAEWGEKCKPYIKSVRLGNEAAGDIQVLIDLRDYWGMEPVEITGYLKVVEKATGRNVTPEMRPIIPSQRIRLRDGYFGWNRDQGLYSFPEEYSYDPATGTLTYPEFRGVTKSLNGTFLSAPILDLTQFPEEINNIEISFGKSGFSFATRTIRQEPLNLLYSQTPNSEVKRMAEHAQMKFLSFPAAPEWDFTGTVTWKLPDLQGDWHIYAIEGSDLTELESTLSEDGGSLCFRARQFGAYVLSDEPLEAAAPAPILPAHENPETGRDALSLAAALSAAALA